MEPDWNPSIYRKSAQNIKCPALCITIPHKNLKGWCKEAYPFSGCWLSAIRESSERAQAQWTGGRGTRGTRGTQDPKYMGDPLKTSYSLQVLRIKCRFKVQRTSNTSNAKWLQNRNGYHLHSVGELILECQITKRNWIPSELCYLLEYCR